MADQSDPDLPARARWLGSLAVVFACISLALHLVDWRVEGQRSWGGPINSVGIGLFGLALIIGRQRRRTYYALAAVSIALVAISLSLTIVRIVRRW